MNYYRTMTKGVLFYIDFSSRVPFAFLVEHNKTRIVMDLSNK